MGLMHHVCAAAGAPQAGLELQAARDHAKDAPRPRPYEPVVRVLMAAGADAERTLLACADRGLLSPARILVEDYGAKGTSAVADDGRVARDVGAASAVAGVASFFGRLGAYLGRYRLVAGPPVHRSRTCEAHCPGPPGRLSALGVFRCKSIFCGVFVWARRALNSQKRRFPAGQLADVSGGGAWSTARSRLCERFCPGRKPAFLAVKRPARPYKSPIQNEFS